MSGPGWRSGPPLQEVSDGESDGGERRQRGVRRRVRRARLQVGGGVPGEGAGQRRAAALLGVNRKTVALALRRERLTARMNHAVQTLLARDDHGGQPAMPLERMQSQIQSLLESMKELDRLVGKLTSRVRALEEAQARTEAETGEEGPVDAAAGEGQQDEPAGEPRRNRSGSRTDGGLAGGVARRGGRLCRGSPLQDVTGTAGREAPLPGFRASGW